MNADPRSYRVRVVSDAVGPEIIGLELSLDAGRPRSVSLAEPTITLGELLSEDVDAGARRALAVCGSGAGLGPGAA